MNATNPFQRSGVGVFNWPDWVGYSFGSIFIALGIAVLFYAPRAGRKARAYKARQLELYNEQHHRKETNYKKTGMYLPVWERVKQMAPVFFGVLFIIIGIAWIVGNTLTTL